jgi:hypothetical protein
MNKVILIFFFLPLFNCDNRSKEEEVVAGQTQRQETGLCPDSLTIKKLAAKFDSLNTKVRDGEIDKHEALSILQHIIPELSTAYSRLNSDTTKQEIMVFPVEEYSSKAIGGKRGEGYIPAGYDFFQGNKHSGHPAQDIFIYDNDQDCVDDRTGKFVNVLSVRKGIVVALEKEWDSTSILRGGKYVWVYSPAENALYYYAHNNDIFVNIGQILNAGDTIATVGRTGLNACKKRSPTHLHFMKLVFDKEFYPRPVDTYKSLILSQKNEVAQKYEPYNNLIGKNFMSVYGADLKLICYVTGS